jgi:pimeloyl-ACP methyl ester carboxylesterase
MPEPWSSVEPTTSRRGFFWVGVERRAHAAGTTVRGPMYVEWEAPPDIRRPHPVVFVHGGGGQGLEYLGTPDGRPGWARILVEEGYAAYVVDRPGHGRAAFHPDLLGAMGPPFTYEIARRLFTPPADGPGSHPTSNLHTQWPGDAALDQFMAATGPMAADFAAAHALEGARLAELLDRIGPAILVAHSAGGPAAWLAADARPGLVKALVAIETMGPPFLANPALNLSLEWGLTAAPITYDPPVPDPAELARETHEPPTPGGPPLVLQAEPARRLPNPRRLPDRRRRRRGLALRPLRRPHRRVPRAGRLRRGVRAPRRPRRPRQRPRDDAGAEQPRGPARDPRLARPARQRLSASRRKRSIVSQVGGGDCVSTRWAPPRVS